MTCPFCGRDPFHRSDFGEPLAVDCCDLGDLFFRGVRPAPETVELSWDEFTSIAVRLGGPDRLVAYEDELSEAIGTDRFMDPPDGGDVSLIEQVRRMHAALDSAETTALAPHKCGGNSVQLAEDADNGGRP